MSSGVLIVDDDPGIRDFLVGLLEDEGYTVRTACDGAEAVAQLISAPRPLPDLVLLDLQMPRLSGWQVLDALRGENVRLPVICMSAGELAPDRAKAAGAVAFLPKPFALEDVLALVARWCGALQSQSERNARLLGEVSSFLPLVSSFRTILQTGLDAHHRARYRQDAYDAAACLAALNEALPALRSITKKAKTYHDGVRAALRSRPPTSREPA